MQAELIINTIPDVIKVLQNGTSVEIGRATDYLFNLAHFVDDVNESVEAEKDLRTPALPSQKYCAS